MKPAVRKTVFATLLMISLDAALGAEFEKLGTAVEKALGTSKAMKKTVKFKGKETTVFYVKGGSKVAVLQTGLYEPNCTHTWVVGLNGQAQVEQVRVVEMKCPHAFPAKEESFLGQYKGKGPADAGSLKGSVNTIAKATGSCDLTSDAVVTSITVADKLKGKL